MVTTYIPPKGGYYMIKQNKLISVIVSALIMTTLFLLLFPELPQAADKIVFTNGLPENSYRFKWFKLVYTEAFRRLGMEYEVKNYPMKRGPRLVNQGKLDGDPGREPDFSTKYPNLLRVDEPIFTGRQIAYTTDNKIKLNNKWESLRNTKFRVNYRRGVILCEENLPKVVRPDKLETVNNDIHGLRKLLAKRIDVYVGIESIVATLLKTKEFSALSFYKAGVMDESKVYTFHHKKHEKLIPKLSAVFKAMKEEGLFEQYDVLAAE
jgi:polar amino acid transport system substrate-binding protein